VLKTKNVELFSFVYYEHTKRKQVAHFFLSLV
jgi:hypothetical protein